ncbi:hypothetical protein ACE38W_14730 [Chitinophaga sp. Hz27]|uniref:hypothetical protein n=1 Tax=Chitinophaga sp. Hz27 TaxID=3347169 RepID=UPI0035DBE635
MALYKNPFHKKGYQDSSPVIATEAIPIIYKGHEIYHRIKSNTPGGNVFDIVKDGTCVGMNAGINGAKQKIDLLLNP